MNLQFLNLLKFDMRNYWLNYLKVSTVFTKNKANINYNTCNTPLPPLNEVPTKGFSS